MAEPPPPFSTASVLMASMLAASVLVFCVLLGSRPAVNRADPKTLALGVEVYRAYGCGTCHTLTAASTRGAFGPPHDGLAETVRRRFADGSYTGSAADVRAYLKESLLEPAAYLVPEYAGSRYLMPAFTDLSPEDVDALVTLLAQP